MPANLLQLVPFLLGLMIVNGDLSSLLCSPSASNTFYSFQQAIYDSNPSILQSIASFPNSDTFLLSNNLDYGYMASARFQVGCGFALMVAISSCKQDAVACLDYIDLAINGTRMGFSTQNETDGSLPLNMPSSVIATYGEPTIADQASAAAFFLGATCSPLIMLQQYDELNHGNYASILDELKVNISKAIHWLSTDVWSNALFAADSNAPNRLFFDTAAFLACGHFIGDANIMNVAKTFLDRIYDHLYDEQYGVFLEGDGWGFDTSYQSVNVEMAIASLLLMPRILHSGYNGSLQINQDFCQNVWVPSVYNATLRLQCSIVQEIPDVNSIENTRTCGGGESFLGRKKELSITAFIYTLLSVGVLNGDSNDGLVSDANALYEYYRIKTQMANSSSCYECEPMQCLGDHSAWCLGLYGIQRTVATGLRCQLLRTLRQQQN